MSNFQYIASNSKGELQRGQVKAANREEVIKILAAQGLFLITCKIVDAALDSLAAPKTPTQPEVNRAEPKSISPPKVVSSGTIHTASTARSLDKRTGKVPAKELTLFTRQMAISINAGMSIVDALQSLARNIKNPVLAKILRRVLEDILSGRKISEALARNPQVFKTVYVSMVAAGEAGGFMPEALNRCAEFLEKEMELRSKIKSALIYPAAIALVAMVVVTFMMTFVVPTFIKVFQEMNVELPLPTRMLIAVSNFTRHGGFLTPVVLALLPLVLIKLRNRYEPFRIYYDAKILRMPIYGKLKTLEIITRFIRTLASLVQNGVTILMALSVAYEVVDNHSIEQIINEIYHSVQQGNGISPVMYESPYFPVLVANMVATGEKTGTIPEVLNKMADYYDAEVSATIRNMLTLMEPLLIVVMAVIVGFVITGLMLPTFELSSHVQG